MRAPHPAQRREWRLRRPSGAIRRTRPPGPDRPPAASASRSAGCGPRRACAPSCAPPRTSRPSSPPRTAQSSRTPIACIAGAPERSGDANRGDLVEGAAATSAFTRPGATAAPPPAVPVRDEEEARPGSAVSCHNRSRAELGSGRSPWGVERLESTDHAPRVGGVDARVRRRVESPATPATTSLALVRPAHLEVTAQRKVARCRRRSRGRRGRPEGRARSRPPRATPLPLSARRLSMTACARRA